MKGVVTLYVLNIELHDLKDSKALWGEIKDFGVNLTDLISLSYVHGICTLEDAQVILLLCEKYAHCTNLSLNNEQV